MNTYMFIQKSKNPEIFLRACLEWPNSKSYKSVLLVNYVQGHGKHIAFSSGCMIIRILLINLHPLEMQFTYFGDFNL